MKDSELMNREAEMMKEVDFIGDFVFDGILCRDLGSSNCDNMFGITTRTNNI